jgi:uncharacterized protein (TIGR03437 family)
MGAPRIILPLFLLPCALLAQPDRITAPIDARRTVVLKGNVHPMAQPRFDQGPVEPAFRLGYVALMLKKTDAQQAALEQLLQQQQDPTSPNYRDWLTPEQYANRFGLSQSDLDQISAWLQSEGFTVEYVARGRNWLAFSGTAGQVRAAFQTEIHRYRVDGEMHFGATAEPSVPASLEPLVAGLVGLDDFYRKAPRHPVPAFTDGTGAHTLAPGDLATIYDIAKLYQANIDGTGQTIAIIGQSDIDQTDIQKFRSNYNLPALNLKTILYAKPDPGTTGDLGEADIDLEWAGAVARNAALIYVYGANWGLASLYAIDNNLAPVISVSFGGCESTNTSITDYYQSEAQKANSLGITWLASSGDTGAAACDDGNIATQGLAVNFPASIPEVTAVGATEFNEGSGTYWNTTNGANGGSAVSYIPEKAWNDTSAGQPIYSTGGGVSSVYPKPAWQTGPGVPADNARDVPDISLDGANNHDPYNVMTGGAWKLFGGTSVSTPAFAGIVALINQYLVAKGVQSKPGVGNINPTLYQLAQIAPNAFHDTTVGNNIVPCAKGTPNCGASLEFGYSAGKGYDLATGLGSVDAYNLVTQWNIPSAVATTTTVIANPAAIPVGGSTALTATVRALSGSTAPSGSVSFTLGSKSLGTANLSGSGGTATASLTVNASQLNTGTNIITASYGGATSFRASLASVTVSVDISTGSSLVVPSMAPNPVFQQAPDSNGLTFFYTVSLSEIAGTAATLTGFTVAGTDYSSQIQNWFGTASIPANGTISASLGSAPNTVPANWVFGFSGTDASGAKWTDQLTVPFLAQPSFASMTLASLPATVALIPDTTHGCASSGPYYQQLNLQEQNGYGVQLTRFLAGGNDLTSDIQPWFGSLRLAPFGSLTAGICWSIPNPPQTLSYEIDGTDTNGRTIVATLSVPFQNPTSSPGALTVSRSSVAMNASPTESAATTVNVTVPSGQAWTLSVFPASQQSGWLTVFPLSGTGPASVNLVAAAPGLANGAYTTTLIFQSPNTTPQFVTVPVAFTIGPSIGGVANGASFAHVYAPGMVLSVFGTNLANSTQTAYSLPLPLTMAGVSATVNGVPAPLYYVSSSQLNIQIPYETATGTALLTVGNNGQVATYSFPVSASAPGIYLQSGNAITPNAGGSRGQIYTLFITGAGEVSPPVATGAGPTGSQVPVPLLAVSMTVGGVAARTNYMGIPSWSVGTLQINFTVPPSAPVGLQPVVVTVGSAASAAANFTVQ